MLMSDGRTHNPCCSARVIKGLGVDGARQVHVQVAALRHAAQKGAQRRMVGAKIIEALGGYDRVEVARDDGNQYR